MKQCYSIIIVAATIIIVLGEPLEWEPQNFSGRRSTQITNQMANLLHMCLCARGTVASE
jgi:hypothetical protein